MLALRAHVLALGYSGVRVEVVERMVEMLNRDLIPAVPEQGSLGASGDLAPLACLALPLLGLGRILTRRRCGTGGRRASARRPRAARARREGGARARQRHAGHARGRDPGARARRRGCSRTADVVAAMTIEAALGTDAAFDERLHALRPHPGQTASAANLRRCSPTRRSASRTATRPTSCKTHIRCAARLRCTAPRATPRAYVGRVLAIEANAVSDNPIVLDDGDVRSGGNFHGMPVAVALDALALSLVSLASISDRRLYRLLDATRSNGLPPFLVPESGLNSGFMLVQYTAASLVSRVQVARASRVGRLDPVERGSGGSRQHGDDRRTARPCRRRQRGGRARAGGPGSGAGARPARRRCRPVPRPGRRTTRSESACRSSSTTVSSAPTSRPRSSWSAAAALAAAGRGPLA